LRHGSVISLKTQLGRSFGEWQDQYRDVGYGSRICLK
jgi:hypothetical protein